MAQLADRLTADNHALAVAIAEVPATMRGFGHVKRANVAAGRAEWDRLMEIWRGERPLPQAAE